MDRGTPGPGRRTACGVASYVRTRVSSPASQGLEEPSPTSLDRAKDRVVGLGDGPLATQIPDLPELHACGSAARQPRQALVTWCVSAYPPSAAPSPRFCEVCLCASSLCRSSLPSVAPLGTKSRRDAGRRLSPERGHVHREFHVRVPFPTPGAGPLPVERILYQAPAHRVGMDVAYG